MFYGGYPGYGMGGGYNPYGGMGGYSSPYGGMSFGGGYGSMGGMGFGGIGGYGNPYARPTMGFGYGNMFNNMFGGIGSIYGGGYGGTSTQRQPFSGDPSGVTAPDSPAVTARPAVPQLGGIYESGSPFNQGISRGGGMMTTQPAAGGPNSGNQSMAGTTQQAVTPFGTGAISPEAQQMTSAHMGQLGMMGLGSLLGGRFY